MRHPRRHDRQRALAGSGPRRLQSEIKFALARNQPLPRGRHQRGQLRLVVRRSDMLDIAGTAPRGVHDLHRRRSRRGPHRAHIRHGPTR
jgi:hypothetical protein